jgi:hypothetical protein
MDYSKLTDTILKKVLAAVALINNPEIDPEIRQLNQEILFREVGTAVYSKVYDMNAFDMEIPHTRGPGIDDRHFGLAKVVSASVSAGALGMHEYVKSYLDSTISMAQRDAMHNARQSGKRPTVTRIEQADACKWCRSKAGTYSNPDPSVFARHGGCNAQIRTSGYRSRNGLLDNYVKPSDR